MLNGATMGVSRNPLMGLQACDMQTVPCVPFAELAPRATGPLLLRVNGEWIAREHWGCTPRIGDVIEWHEMPQDKEGARSILQIAGTIISLIPGYQAVGYWILAASVAYNILVPPDLPTAPVQPESTSDVFSASLNGNQARLDQPVWKVCGHQEINPPYACQPYYETRPKPGAADPELDRDQYFFGIFAVTVGNAEVVPKIGNTALTRFSDIVVANYLAPGVQPAQVKTNVTSAVEVSGQILASARRVGGFSACAANQRCSKIGIDVTAGRGLGKTDTALTVEWRVQYREINDFGQVLGVWTTLAEETRTAFTSTPQRWTNTYTLPGLMRVEISVVRTDVEDTDARALHEIAWSAMRAYREDAIQLDPDVSHYELVLRATSQLSNLGSRDFRLIVDGYVRTWSTGGGWGPEILSRNGAWWCLELASNPVWGIGQPDALIDLASFERLAATAEARQDRFDYTFQSTVNGWEAMQLIARTMRARVFRRNGVISIVRDELATVGVTAFTPRNCPRNSMRIVEKLPKSNSPDGIIVSYRDHRSGDWVPIECPCPGVVEMVNPVYMNLDGVIGATHAEREGIYQAYNLAYRTRQCEWRTEMEGILPAFMSPVKWAAEIPGYGTSGDVTDWDEPTLTITLSEPVDFSSGTPFIILIRDDGSLTDPVAVLPGPASNKVVLPEAPDFEIIVDDGTRERPKFLIGPVDDFDIVKITKIGDGGRTDDGAQMYTMEGLIDDPRVHMADVALLPTLGEIQDPIGYPDDDAGGGFVTVPNLPSVRSLSMTAADYSSSYVFRANGTSAWVYVGTLPASFTEEFANEWIIGAPVEVIEAAQFEVFFHSVNEGGGWPIVTGAATLNTPTLETWLPCGVDYTFSSTIGPGTGVVQFHVEISIREASTLTVVETGNVYLISLFPSDSGGD